jgi:hypothetical protein
VARTNTLTQAISRFLRGSETLVATSRATARGGVMTSAVMAGAGAAIGYTVSTFIGDGAIAAAIGGGVGGGLGVLVGSVISSMRMRKRMSIRAATVTLALTDKRLLIFRQSWLSNRATDLVGEIPIGTIASIEVGRARLITPHPITITLEDGTVLAFEAAKVEKPGRLEEGFRSTPGG